MQDTVVIAVQEKGKLRGTVEVAMGAGEDEVVAVVASDDKLKGLIEGSVRRIFVENRVINFI